MLIHSKQTKPKRRFDCAAQAQAQAAQIYMPGETRIPFFPESGSHPPANGSAPCCLA
jgi:hypothetical protein